ncbi:alanyl-tRNA editing protein [Haloarcula amylovorans]|uniref:alanyl-tRNA editing protein n=1 Tax=Haloarcula amylovorans TaxID=2562280 RepID=UPI0010760305|nr:DHHA1 domain-containing protein [Halomicroarcula amylolytica]
MTVEATANLASEQPYVTLFDATVRSVDGCDVTLNQTYFYAEGGGQPADRGTLSGISVVDVQKHNGETVHTLAEAPDIEVGATVSGEIDEQFRTYSMRAHTASHVVYGVGRKLFDSHGYGGFDIGEDNIRLDFYADTDADGVNALTFQRMANEAVWDGRSVEWYEMDTEEARDDDDIVFNLGDADPADSVRIVEIDDWDISACGGTHVRNTNEIGSIEVIDVSNPGADLVRVEYAVGPSAIQHQIDRRRSVSRAADMLDTSVEDLAQRSRELLEEKKSLQADVDELHKRLLDARISSLAADTTTRDGQEWLVGTVDSVGPNTVANRVGALNEDAGDVVVLTGRDGSTFVVVGTDGETDANAVIDDVTGEFGGGGGGQPTLAQGGGLDADPETVVEYLR